MQVINSGLLHQNTLYSSSFSCPSYSCSNPSSSYSFSTSFVSSSSCVSEVGKNIAKSGVIWWRFRAFNSVHSVPCPNLFLSHVELSEAIKEWCKPSRGKFCDDSVFRFLNPANNEGNFPNTFPQLIL